MFVPHHAFDARRSSPAVPGASACLLALGLIVPGCDDGGSSGSADTEPVDSGFADTEASEGDGPTSASTGQPSTTDDTTTPDTDDAGDASGYDTLGEGDLRGMLSFTLYAADSANPEPLLGMAGAWRNEGDELEGVEDFFGVFGLGTQFPTPPADVDTLEQNSVPAAFEWGGPTQWVLAGNGMKLVAGDVEASACLLYYGGESEVEFPPSSGTFVPNYPIYAATNSPNQPEGCAPDAATWLPDTDYDIVLYGGSLFDTNALDAQVHTPDMLEVTTPDTTTFGLPLPIDEDLTVEWTGSAGEDTRMVLRVFDMFGRMFTVRADDDGSFDIPAAELAALAAGPATLTVAREHLEEVPFTDGTVSVLSRYEQWVYIELY